MALAEQWDAIVQSLDPKWSESRFLVRVDDETRVARAVALLAPTAPGRAGREIRFFVGRGGAGVGPEAVRRSLKRIDEEGISGSLEVVSSQALAAQSPTREQITLAAGWDAALATLPADWSDLLCELQLTSSDYIEHAALLTAPMNPLLAGTGKPDFRFRVARRFGYGAAPELVRRLLERLDEAGITGRVRVERALSDTHAVATQGPVWYVGGRTV